jgi:hypothetical protein
MPKPTWVSDQWTKRSTAGTKRKGTLGTEEETGRPPDLTTHFSPLVAKLSMKAIQNAPTMEGALRRARTLRVLAWNWVKEYEGDYGAFRSDWLVARMLLPLQCRLLVEQVLYDMGPPWTKAVTGFNPM